MEKVQTKIDEQLHFWSAIGPFMTLLTLIVCLTKGSAAQSGYAVIGLIGIPLCLRWKKQGMLLSLVLLTAVFVYQVPGLVFDQQLWSAGIFISFALSFFVTALSFEESSHIVGSIVADSNSRLNQMLALDEKVKGIESELEEERVGWNTKLEVAQKESVLHKEKFEATQLLVDTAQQELTAIYGKNKELLEELFTLKSKAADAVSPADLQALREKLHSEEERALTLELQLEEKDSFYQKQCIEIEQLRQHLQKIGEETTTKIARLAEEKESLKQKISQEEERLLLLELQLEEKKACEKKSLEEVQQLQSVCEEKNNRITELTKDSTTRVEAIETLQKQVAEYKVFEEQQRQELSQKEAALQEFAAQLEQLHAEKEALLAKKKTTGTAAKKETAAYRKLQGMYKQLKEQFEEKCAVLDETRRAQFHMQERVFNAQRELEEKQRTDKSEAEAALEKHLLKMEEEHKRLEKEYAEELDALNHIIASLSSK